MRLVRLLLALALLSGCRRSADAAPPGPQIAPSSSPPGQTVAAAGADVPFEASHQFYGVYVAGQKAGYAEEWIRPAAQGVEMETQVHLTLTRLGQTMKLELSDRVTYGPAPEGALVSFETVEDLGDGGRTVRTGTLGADAQLSVTVKAGAATTTKSIAPPKERAHDVIPALLIPRLLAARTAGAPLEQWQFDRSTFDDVRIEARITEEREARVSGVPTRILTVEGKDAKRGLTLGSRLTPSGRTLEMTVGPGFKLVLEDEAVAKDRSVAAPDLYKLALVPVDKALGDPSGLVALDLRLVGLSPDANVVDSRQQRDGEQVSIRSVACQDLPEVALAEVDRLRWLEATAFLDHEDASLRAFLARTPAGADRPGRLSHAVHSALRYSLATAPMSASTILAGGQGDCTEYSRLLVAVLRAAGLPAREVSGMAYSGDSEKGFAFHAWAEVFIASEGAPGHGRWCPLDPTWDQTTLDASHVALSRDDPTPIIGLLGGVRAEVLSLKRR